MRLGLRFYSETFIRIRTRVFLRPKSGILSMRCANSSSYYEPEFYNWSPQKKWNDLFL